MEQVKPLSSKKRKGRAYVFPLEGRKRHKHECRLGDLNQLGMDLIYKVLSFVDAETLRSCLAVNWSLRNIITSSHFRRIWHGKPGVLVQSWTLPWKLWTRGDASSATLFQPLNSSSRHLRTVASAGGLVCISMQPDVLDLVVGNPLTSEWVALPIPDILNHSHHAVFTMEVVGTGGHFKIGVHDMTVCYNSCRVYDSVSGRWQVAVLHLPFLNMNYVRSWPPLYDLSRSCWRDVQNSAIKTGLENQLGGVHVLNSNSRSVCMWEYKGRSYFASPWSAKQASKFTGYGVWRVAEDTGELVKLGVLVPEYLMPSQRLSISISCNALDNLVCFSAETSQCYPATPVVVYDLDDERWTAFKVPPAPTSVELEIMNSVKAVIYSPSLLSPAR